jgi:hypothetical protein
MTMAGVKVLDTGVSLSTSMALQGPTPMGSGGLQEAIIWSHHIGFGRRLAYTAHVLGGFDQKVSRTSLGVGWIELYGRAVRTGRGGLQDCWKSRSYTPAPTSSLISPTSTSTDCIRRSRSIL